MKFEKLKLWKTTTERKRGILLFSLKTITKVLKILILTQMMELLKVVVLVY